MIGSWRNPKKNNRENNTPDLRSHISRDLMLPRDIQEVQDNLPSTCEFRIPNPNELFKQELVVTPSRDSMWHGGKFTFVIDIPPEYNYKPPKVRCQTPIYHPNINESGKICLSILRDSNDEFGWRPTRSLMDLISGINSLFSDLVNFEDPLNSAAAEHYTRDPRGFARQVKDYISRYCSN